MGARCGSIRLERARQPPPERHRLCAWSMNLAGVRQPCVSATPPTASLRLADRLASCAGDDGTAFLAALIRLCGGQTREGSHQTDAARSWVSAHELQICEASNVSRRMRHALQTRKSEGDRSICAGEDRPGVEGGYARDRGSAERTRGPRSG